MGLTAGIVGLPNVGKTTIFNALCGAGAPMASYAFTTIEPNRGVVKVPDERLVRIAQILHKPDPIPTSIELTDVAGLVKGASRGEGLGNQFLGHIRNVDALIHVLRCFESPEAQHVMGAVDPVRDMEVINTELMLADLEHLGREHERIVKRAKAGDRELLALKEELERMMAGLNQALPLRRMELSEEMRRLAVEYGLITAKPLLYVANLGEGGGDTQAAAGARESAQSEGAGFLAIKGKLEEEVSELDAAEVQEFRAAMDLDRSGLDLLIDAAYRMLDLITFYTATTALQAWTLRRGTNARAAAGRIHSDFERGFIRAEVVHYEGLLAAGDEHRAREKGLLRAEGKEYVVRDGDVIHFLFNV